MQKEIDEYKDRKARLSNLNSQGKKFPLVNDEDQNEFWSYLAKFKKSENRTDGMIVFIVDLYRGIKINKTKMDKDFIEITVRIKETLMKLSDDLHRILEAYRDSLINVD